MTETVDSIELLYGRGTLKVDVPKECRPTVIKKLPMPVLEDPKAAVWGALSRDAPVAEAARGAQSACILICDITRPVPNHLFLRPLIESLIEAGVPKTRITVLVATGLHRPNLEDELAELVGDPWVLKHVEVANHYAEDEAAHVDLGATARGTPILLDRRLVEADLKIATGLVEPHFMAGWSGGRKVIAPGVAQARTIRTFHNAAFMSHPRATNCVLEGNPLHEEQLEIVKRLGLCWALNCVIDEERRLAFVNFGEIVQSHLEAVAFMQLYARVGVAKRFKTVVTSAAGYPLDKTYYQTVKGMVGPMDILEPGGDLIIASECSEGIGSAAFAASQKRLVQLGNDGFMSSIQVKDLADIDEWQTQMQLRSTGTSTVHLHTTGLLGEDLKITGVTPALSVAEAVTKAIKQHNDPEVAFIPEGPYVVPFVEGEAA